MDTVIYYIEHDEKIDVLELDEAPLNFKDFLQNFINCGFSNFKIYDSLCNFGAFGLIAEVKNKEIIFIND